MANTFDEQAKERFQKSLAFMHKAEALLQDDLIYRSALADSVSAIKNMLQGYLLYRVAQMPPSAVSQRWQEIAISNRMPELIATCGEAGLDLRGLAVEIKHLNNERNNRAHDDPQQMIDPEQARRAAELARILQKRIKLANEGKTDTRTIAQRAVDAVEVVRGAVSGQLKPVAATASPAAVRAQAANETAAPAPVAVAVATATPSSTVGAPPSPPAPHGPADAKRASTDAAPTAKTPETAATATDAMQALDDTSSGADDGDEGGDSSELPALPRRGRARGRRRRMLARLIGIAAVLIIGVAAGVGAAVPVSRGDAPGWLSFTKGWFAANSTPTVTITPTATEPVVSGATAIGTVAIGAPVCANGVTSVTLTNLGTSPANWATGSPDAENATFGTSVTAATQPTLTGTLAASKQVTFYVAGPAVGTAYHISVVASGGAVQLLVRSC